MEEDEAFYYYQYETAACCNIQKLLQLILTISITIWLGYEWYVKCIPVLQKYNMINYVTNMDFIQLRKKSKENLNKQSADTDIYIQTKGKFMAENADKSVLLRLADNSGTPTATTLPKLIQDLIVDKSQQAMIYYLRLEQMCVDGTEKVECFKDWMSDDDAFYI